QPDGERPGRPDADAAPRGAARPRAGAPGVGDAGRQREGLDVCRWHVARDRSVGVGAGRRVARQRARRRAAAAPRARAAAPRRRRAHRQADRFRRRRARREGARGRGQERPRGGRLLDAPGDDRRSDVDRRRGGHHAAQVHVVRAEAPRRAADSHHMKVLIADKFEKSGIDGLKAAGWEVVYEPELKEAALAQAIASSGADVLVVRGTKVDAAMLDAGHLSLVVRAGAGYNTIDVAAASTRGIYVSNCPGKNAIAVAELAF